MLKQMNVLVLAGGLAGFLALAAMPPSARADDEALVTFQTMTPETALELARATLADCRKRGYQVAVSVVDRMGVLQVTLRDRFAAACDGSYMIASRRRFLLIAREGGAAGRSPSW